MLSEKLKNLDWKIKKKTERWQQHHLRGSTETNNHPGDLNKCIKNHPNVNSSPNPKKYETPHNSLTRWLTFAH